MSRLQSLVLLPLLLGLPVHAQRTPERLAGQPAIEAAKPLGAGAQPFDAAPIGGRAGGPIDLPWHHEVIALPPGTGAAVARLADQAYEPAKPAETSALAGIELGPEPVIESHVAWQRKKPFLQASLLPYRRNPATGQVERLRAFRLEAEVTGGAERGAPKMDYPEHSRLAQGDWFRFSVARDGVHRITYDFLRNMGALSAPIASERINLYGGHHGLLPFQNNVLVPTDLTPNAIEVVDGGDGLFGPGDHILFYATGPTTWQLGGNGLYRHIKHVFSDSASYFVGIDVEPPVRVADLGQSGEAPTRTVTRFNDRQVIDRDQVNLIKSGRTWFGEVYDLVTTYAYSFDTPNLVADEPITLEACVAARTYNQGATVNTSTFLLSSGSAFSGSIPVPGIINTYTGPTARQVCQTFTWNASGNQIPLSVTFNKHDPLSSIGWMDYLRINCTRELRM
ncbi:MAG: hypothetical protein ACK4L7_01130, partial [Flavobacteriales bacterium]